jgi:hypothetical protein
MYGRTQDAFSTGTFYRCGGSRGRTPGPARTSGYFTSTVAPASSSFAFI